MAKEYRVFLSCVSSEFEGAREAVKDDLATKGLTVRWQEAFRHEQGASTLLRLLHDYIRDCDIVVCFHGVRSGACPPAATVTPFVDMLPGHMTQASFTQWEYIFAHYHGKDIMVFRANDRYVPDRPDGDDIPGLQQQFKSYVDDMKGSFFLTFGDVSELRIEVMKADWPNLRAVASIENLPRWLIFFPLILLANLISLATGSGTVLDLAHPDLWLKPTKKPSMDFFVAQHSGHTLLITKWPGQSNSAMIMNLEVPKSLDIGANGCPVDVSSAAASAGGPRIPCEYDKEKGLYRITADIRKMRSNEAIWMFNLGEDRSDNEIAATIEQDGVSSGGWSIRNRPAKYGGPCISIRPKSDLASIATDPGLKCFGEATPEDRENTNSWTDDMKQMYYGQLILRSRYDAVVDKINLIALLGFLGFSTLIAIMANEVTGLGLPFFWLIDKVGHTIGLSNREASRP